MSVHSGAGPILAAMVLWDHKSNSKFYLQVMLSGCFGEIKQINGTAFLPESRRGLDLFML